MPKARKVRSECTYVFFLLRRSSKNTFRNSFSDPHVRIVGKVEQVQRAKDSILSTLDSRVSLGSVNDLR